MANDNATFENVLNDKEQEALLGHCITDYKFFLKCKGKIKSNWFSGDGEKAFIFDVLVEIYNRDGFFIKSVDEFKADDIFRYRSQGSKVIKSGIIDRCIFSSGEFDAARIRRKLTGWMRVSLFKLSTDGAVRLYNSKGFESAFTWTQEHIKQIQSASFEEIVNTLPFEDAATWLKKDQEVNSKKISTGSMTLDHALGGGLFKGETCAILAPSNSGKSTFMMTLVRHLVFQKRHTLFMIHEGDARTLRRRILCAYMGINNATLYDMLSSKHGVELINIAGKDIDKYLQFVPYIKAGGMYCEDVIELVKELNQERISKHGTGFDVFINDYPKKLKMKATAGSKNEIYRASLADVYDQFNFLASELDLHCFVAIQVNREGAKDNSGKNDSKTLLAMENVDESYGITQNMANIISLNRGPDDKKLNICRLNITKSRNGETDIVVNTRTNYACGLVYGDKENFDFGKAWKMDIKYLTSRVQPDNKRYDAQVILETLDRIDKGELVDLNGVKIV